MTVPVKNLTITVTDQTGAAVAAATVTATLSGLDLYNAQYVFPNTQTFTTDVNGLATMPLFPNALGQKNTRYTIKAVQPVTLKTLVNVSVYMPNINCDVSALVGNNPASNPYPPPSVQPYSSILTTLASWASTAAVIALGPLGTMAVQNANAVAITGGTIAGITGTMGVSAINASGLITASGGINVPTAQSITGAGSAKMDGITIGSVTPAPLTATSGTFSSVVNLTGTGANPNLSATVTDNTTASVSQVNAFSNTSNVFLGAHASARVVSRYGITLGGWAEMTDFDNIGTSNGMIIGTQGAVPIVFGTNNVERGRFTTTGLTVASGQTLTLTGATVAGAPTWSSSQAITLSTAAQPNVTSVGTLTGLTTGDITFSGASKAIRNSGTFVMLSDMGSNGVNIGNVGAGAQIQFTTAAGVVCSISAAGAVSFGSNSISGGAISGTTGTFSSNISITGGGILTFGTDVGTGAYNAAVFRSATGSTNGAYLAWKRNNVDSLYLGADSALASNNTEDMGVYAVGAVNLYSKSTGSFVKTAAITGAGLAVTGTLSATGNLTVSGAGPHAIGGTTDGTIQLRLLGSFTSSGTSVDGFRLGSTLLPGSGGAAYALHVEPTLTMFGSGTHTDFASAIFVPPAINGTPTTINNTTTLKITGAPSVGTNQRALWVAAGTSQFDGALKFGSLGAFAASDKYLIVDSSGNVHVSALGPAS